MSNLPSIDTYMSNLPRPLDLDSGMHDLGETAATALMWLWADIDLPAIYKNIDSLPESVLDILAKDLKIDWYDFNYSIETKRTVIKGSFYVHRHLGTRGAVDRALSDVWPPSYIEEWWEYGGSPFYFRAVLCANTANEPIYINGTRNVINFYKSVRSHMEGNGIIIRIICGIKVKTQRDGWHYHVRLSGTYPRIAQHGDIAASVIEVETEKNGLNYHVPQTNEVNAGEWPKRSTHGHISASDIEIETDREGSLYHVPKANEGIAGEWPRQAAHGNISEPGLVISSDFGLRSSSTRLCGESMDTL